MTDVQVSGIFMAASQRFAREHGIPLPNQMLEIGDPDKDWGVRLNPTHKTIDDVGPFLLHVTWFGLPAGIIGPSGGIISAGRLANETTFCVWLLSDLVGQYEGRANDHRNAATTAGPSKYAGQL